MEHLAAMLNYFGVSVAAASGVGLKINTFAGMPCWTIGQAVSPILPAVTGLIYFKSKSWESKKKYITGHEKQSGTPFAEGWQETDFLKKSDKNILLSDTFEII